MTNDAEPTRNGAPVGGPVAGETLKDGLRWVGHVCFGIAIAAFAGALFALAVGHPTAVVVCGIVAAIGAVLGTVWFWVERRRLRRRRDTVGNERPEDL